jgi:hypothetical protein
MFALQVTQDLQKAKYYYSMSAAVSPDAAGLLESTEEAIAFEASGGTAAVGTVRVSRQKFTLEDAIGPHACSLHARGV